MEKKNIARNIWSSKGKWLVDDPQLSRVAGSM
jgi:hypothetical protein